MLRAKVKRKAGYQNPLIPSPFWDLYRDGITFSSLSKFLDCPEKFRLSMQEGWSQKSLSGAAQFGNIFHEVLDRMYSGERPPERDCPQYLTGLLNHMFERDAKKQVLRDFDELEQNYGMAGILLRHYFHNWSKDFKSHKWITLEHKFRVEFPGSRPIPINGKIDGVFELNGKLWMLETKTKGQIEEDKILDKLNFDGQIMLYAWACKQIFGKYPTGVLYNVARRPQLRRKVSETLQEFLNRCDVDMTERPAHYFIRYECAFGPGDIQDWVDNDLAESLVELSIAYNKWIGSSVYPRWRRNSGACTGRGYTCEFLPVCGRQDFTYLEKRKDLFPELVEG